MLFEPKIACSQSDNLVESCAAFRCSISRGNGKGICLGRASMSRRRFRVRTSLVAAAVTVGSFLTPMVNPTDANAAILPGPTTSLNAGFHNNPASLVQALLCPLVTVVKTVTSTIPGVNVLTDQLANIICALNVLGYVYRITYYPPSGPPQVRYYSALVGVPALLDVNGDGLPDTVGLVTPNAGLNIVGLQLQITRLGLPPTAKAKIEAVFIDPVDATHTTYVGVGEDGSTNGLAANWRLVVGAFLSSLTGPTVDLQASIFTSQPPSSLTTFGEAMFGSDPDAPTTIYAGQMNFTPMQNMTVRLAIGSSSQEADVTTTGPTVLGAHVQAITPGDEKDIDVTVDQLPTAIALIHQTSSGHEQISYSANSTINHITGQYHDRHGSSIITAAQADITGLPSAFTLDLIDSKVNFNVPVGAIGNIEVRFATNHEVPASPAGTAPYVAFHRFTTSHLEAGLRIGNIKSVSFDSGGPYFGDLVFSIAPGYIPLSFEDDVSGITANGHLSNLPAHLTVTIDLAGHVVFDGHGTGIDEIFIHATKSPGTFFTKANRVDLTIDGLPALDTIDFTPDGTTVNFTPSAPIAFVSFLASDGTDAPSVVGDYASYEDTPSLYRLYVQMQSIAGVSFSTSPTMHAVLKTGISQPMVLHAHIADAAATHNITLDGSITNLPTTIDVNADLNNGKIVYNASSTIADIHFHATDSAANFFTRANTLDADLQGLPTTNTITFLPSGTGATFTPSSPIGQISLLASDGTVAPVVSGVYASYEDTPSLYRIYLQMQSIAGLSFNTQPSVSATLKTGVSLPMTLFAHVDDGTAHNLTVNGLIDSLPTTITVNADLTNGQVVYNASSTINEIHVTATDSRSNFFTRANKLDLDLKGLPTTNTITFLPSGTGATFTPSSPITSISLLATTIGTNAPIVSGDYASYEDTPSLYRIYLNMLGLSGLSFSVPSNGAISGTIKTANQQVFNLLGHVSDGSTYDVNATGQINKLPSWIDFSMTPSTGGNSVVDYNTHGQVINSVTLDASGLPLPFGADTVHAEIDHIPSHITVTIPGSGGTAIFDPHGDTINRVLVQAFPHTSTAFNGVVGHQTVYANLQTGRFTADIQNIGFTKINTDPNNLAFQYDISSAPLDFNVTTDTGTYFKGQISNPEPATITVNTNNQTKIVYTVNQSGANYTGNGYINEIDVQTNAKGYLDAALQHIAPRLTVCVDGGGSAPCQPGFVPRGSFQDTDNNTWYMPASLFNFSVIPQNFDGSTPSTRFRLDGTYCFNETDAATCLDSGQKKQRIVISDLEFGKIAVGVGKSDDDCTLCTAGRVDAYFDTDNTNISGDVQYFSSDGDDDPFVHYHTDAPDQGIAAQNLFEFVQYCIVCLNEDNLDIVHGGTFTCNGSPHLDIDIPVFDDIDVLSGSFISIC